MLLNKMRRSHIWFLIAFLWVVDAAIAALRHGWRAAALPGGFALVFFVVGVIYRRREKIVFSASGLRLKR